MKGNKKPHIREVICLVLEVGLEPTKPKARDLQSPVIATTRFQHGIRIWSRLTDSNRGPTVYKTAALTN